MDSHPAHVVRSRSWTFLLMMIMTGPSVTAWALPPAQEVEQRVTDLLARMTLAEKIGQLQQLDSVPNAWRVRDEHRGLIPQGPGRLVPERPGGQEHQRSPAHGGRAVAAEDPPDLRL